MTGTSYSISILQHLYLSCICFIALAGVPLVPRKLDDWFPIPIDGLSCHELLESVFMYILSFIIFSLYYRIVTFNKTNIPSVTIFIPILLSLLISIEGNGIHWSCNAIHSTFNPGNEKKVIQHSRHKTLYSLTYFLDEIWGHHLLIGGNCLSFIIIICSDYLSSHHQNDETINKIIWFDILLFYSLSFLMGLVLFAAGIEGQTATTIILPFSFIVIIQKILFKLPSNAASSSSSYNIQTFMCYVSFWAIIFTLCWGYYFNWTFPEFRVLGFGPFSTWIGKFMHVFNLYNP